MGLTKWWQHRLSCCGDGDGSEWWGDECGWWVVVVDVLHCWVVVASE